MLNKMDEFRESFLEERDNVKKIVDLLKDPAFDQNGPPIVLIHALAELIVNHAVARSSSEEDTKIGLNVAAKVLVSYGLAVHRFKLLNFLERSDVNKTS